MKNNKIGYFLVVFFMIRGVFLLNCFSYNIISLVTGSLLGYLFFVLYKSFNLSKNKITKFIILVICIYFSILFLSEITNYISYNILLNTSPLIIIISILFIIVILSFKKNQSYIKLIELSFYIILVFGLLSLILLFPKISFDGISLIINNQIPFHIINYSIYSFLTLIIINYFYEEAINIRSYFITLLNIIIIKLITINILGNKLINIYQYPYLSIFKEIKYFDFIERCEVLLSIQYLFDYFFLISLIVLVIKKIISDLFNIKKDKNIKTFLSIIILFIFIMTLLIT